MQTAGNELPITTPLQDMMSYSKLGLIGMVCLIVAVLIYVIVHLIIKMSKNAPAPVPRIASEDKIRAAKEKYNKLLMDLQARYEMEKKEVPKEEILMYLRGIQEAIEGFDLDTADAAMEKLEECRLPEECIPLMEKLRPLFADVAMEDIISVADKMIALLEDK